MKSLSALTDPVYVPKEKFNLFERLWLHVINDKRDLPFAYLLTTIHLIVLLPAILLFTPVFQGWIWWAVAVPYFYISQLYFKGRFGLMFHCICHRKFFKKKYQWLHTYITWIICPLFGHAPEGYYSHHLGMHHVENNMDDDTSSTMYYQRDNFGDFLKYFTTFILVGVKNTILYLYYRKRRKLYMRLTVGEYVYLAFCIGMCFVNLKATLVVCIVPLIFARFVMMLGNWTQHSFVDHAEPENLYKNSINCINTVYNQTCWNDGYHIIHHLRPGMHYTEMPNEFLKRKDEFAENKAIVFDGIHYLHIFTWLMMKKYDKLADNLVNINGMFSSREEAISLMKERARKLQKAS
ncbi:MAG: fatty acid desaturase [Sphingobacteriales bacterium SCN 48-20]|jgi:fatty acid desaturase|uniref:fatty acid desaturase family protein n=1 Tax=Terrimonas ferruginea TaxID=249 RepID=UPI00086F4CB3|nr:fatty acid desaturase [Terrimonas ferruginea]MBN8782555.1 fatty acid desaturase [Terrimonas ferruginea]ODT94107.1 MAG: fatty acid desaturase [Sphingobacteriales bacterium SCN 48-20]OJW43059.1 MAG: fatty acid desaturase [Sphingobacteriales bacterium 48-107]